VGKTWFQSLGFHKWVNLYRYGAVKPGVGLCTLNQVDP
jgi:hypothetical protein